MRRLILAGALVLSGCPAPRYVSGVVFGRAADDEGVHALVSPVEGATVTWSCPADTVGPSPQTMKTDYEGRFKSKETHIEMPETCALVVEKDGFSPRAFRSRSSVTRRVATRSARCVPR